MILKVSQNSEENTYAKVSHHGDFIGKCVYLKAGFSASDNTLRVLPLFFNPFHWKILSSQLDPKNPLILPLEKCTCSLFNKKPSKYQLVLKVSKILALVGS